MKHFESKQEYEQFVQTVAEKEQEMVKEVPEEQRPSHLDGYQGFEDEYTIAKAVIGVPVKVGDEVTMRFNGEPWVDTRACPVTVFLYSDHHEVLSDEIVDDRDIYRATIKLFAHDLKDELTA